MRFIFRFYNLSNLLLSFHWFKSLLCLLSHWLFFSHQNTNWFVTKYMFFFVFMRSIIYTFIAISFHCLCFENFVTNLKQLNCISKNDEFFQTKIFENSNCSIEKRVFAKQKSKCEMKKQNISNIVSIIKIVIKNTKLSFHAFLNIILLNGCRLRWLSSNLKVFDISKSYSVLSIIQSYQAQFSR